MSASATHAIRRIMTSRRVGSAGERWLSDVMNFKYHIFGLTLLCVNAVKKPEHFVTASMGAAEETSTPVSKHSSSRVARPRHCSATCRCRRSIKNLRMVRCGKCDSGSCFWRIRRRFVAMRGWRMAGQVMLRGVSECGFITNDASSLTIMWWVQQAASFVL